MEQQVLAAFSPVAISAVIVAIFMAASRLAPFTKPYWSFFPKVVQGWLPSLVAGLPIALNAFGTVKTWMDFAQALLVVGVIPLALAAPGANTPSNPPGPPPPNDKGKDDGGPKPPNVPPLAAAALLGLCLALTGCGLFATSEPQFGHAAVFIADAGNAVSAAEALLPSLHLGGNELAIAKDLIARARAALSAAASANNGAKALNAEELDASLAAFRTAWANIREVFAASRVATAKDEPALPTPVCMHTTE